jgi:hypothetical protein
MIYAKPLLRSREKCLLQCSTGSSASVDSTCDAGPNVNDGGNCESGNVPNGATFLNQCNVGGAATGCSAGNGVGTGCGTGNAVT